MSISSLGSIMVQNYACQTSTPSNPVSSFGLCFCSPFSLSLSFENPFQLHYFLYLNICPSSSLEYHYLGQKDSSSLCLMQVWYQQCLSVIHSSPAIVVTQAGCCSWRCSSWAHHLFPLVHGFACCSCLSGWPTMACFSPLHWGFRLNLKFHCDSCCSVYSDLPGS